MKKYFWTAESNDKSFSDKSRELFDNKEDAYNDMRNAALEKMKWNTEWIDFAAYCEIIDYTLTFERNKIVHTSYSGTYVYEIQVQEEEKKDNDTNNYLFKNFNEQIRKIVANKDFLVTFLADATYSSFWAMVTIHKDTTKEIRNIAKKNNNECREDEWADVLLNNGYINVLDVEEDENYKISLNDIINGFKILIIKYPTHYANIMDENSDFYDMDALLQCSVFKDVIYG